MTLSTYCVEHELLVRALKEAERVHPAEAVFPLAVDSPVTAETADGAQEPAPL